MQDTNRNKIVAVRVTADERDTFSAAAKLAGTTLSDVCRGAMEKLAKAMKGAGK